MFATRTCPSFPGYTSSIHPSCQFPLEVSGDITSITSLTWTSRCVLDSFRRAFNHGNHSRSHLLQKCLTSYCILRHLFRRLSQYRRMESEQNDPKSVRGENDWASVEHHLPDLQTDRSFPFVIYCNRVVESLFGKLSF